jgi:putative N6-adenine-specific DNA methylase
MPAVAANPALFDCLAVVTPGLEALALADAQRAGVQASIGEGGLVWTGDARRALLANATLRIASRVIVRLASFEARSFVELERHARLVAWGRVVKPGSAVRFRVTCKKSKLYHSDAVAQRVADAVSRAVVGVRAEGATVGDEEVGEEEASALIVVRMMRDHCTISADSSGALLHRRGYRQATAKAPLRETLAAALIEASGWDGVAPLVDPLCGSGTIPIEAALRARELAPGLGRTFAMEQWPSVSPTLGARVRSELAKAGRPSAAGPIVGSDRDAGAIEAATANADRAGVSADVAFAVRSISAADFPEGPMGFVVTNPPYGVRVGDTTKVRDLWAQFGRVLRERAPGWRVALLSPDAALDRQLGFPTRTVATTSNGGIPVRIVAGEVPR